MYDRDFEFEDHNISADLQRLIDRYEDMLLTDSLSFFEEEEFEMIIEYYQDCNNFEEAIQATEIAHNQYQYSESFLLRKAELLFELKKCEAALEYIAKAEILDAGDVEIYLLKSEVLTFLGRYEEAITTLEKSLELADREEQDDLYVSLADVYEASEHFDAAFEALKKALEINPVNEDALNKIWFSVGMAEKYEESIDLHQKLIDEDPYSYLAWYNLGQAYMGLELYEKAAYAFEYVTLIHEDYDLVYRDWAEALVRMEDYEKAIEIFDAALKFTEPYEEIYFGMGQCYEKLGKLDKARYYYRKAAHLDPYFDDSFFRIAETYKAEGRLSEALTAYKKALKLNDENVEYLAAYAEALYETGNLEEAILNFQTAVSLRPSVVRNWEILARLLFEVNARDLLSKTLDDAVAHLGDNVEVLYLRAAYLLGIGIKSEGVEALAAALAKNSKKYHLLFNFVPSLADDDQVCQLIEQYK